jgi:hypothetical protein
VRELAAVARTAASALRATAADGSAGRLWFLGSGRQDVVASRLCDDAPVGVFEPKGYQTEPIAKSHVVRSGERPSCWYTAVRGM